MAVILDEAARKEIARRFNLIAARATEAGKAALKGPLPGVEGVAAMADCEAIIGEARGLGKLACELHYHDEDEDEGEGGYVGNNRPTVYPPG